MSHQIIVSYIVVMIMITPIGIFLMVSPQI